MNDKHLNEFISEALAIEAREAKEAGALGYMVKALVQATMPHKRTPGTEFTRTNGTYTLTILSPSNVGLPWGSIPRLVLAWVTTEAVKTGQRTLVLGDSLSDFMDQLDLIPTGGRWGSIIRVKRGVAQLFAASISFSDEREYGFTEGGFRIADKQKLWWEPKTPNQTNLFKSTVTLSEIFFNEIINTSVPVDMGALKALKQSPMALDIYCWLTYRMSYLDRRTEIPWVALQAQFGAGYPVTAEGTRNFKKKFLKHLRKVRVVYQGVKAGEGDYGLILKPGKPHIPMLTHKRDRLST